MAVVAADEGVGGELDDGEEALLQRLVAEAAGEEVAAALPVAVVAAVEVDVAAQEAGGP